MADPHACLGSENVLKPEYACSDSEEFGDALLDALGSDSTDEDEQDSRVRL